MQGVPISNDAIADVVWAALEMSDRCKGGTDIEINILPSGAVVLNFYLQGYNESTEYRQYRISTEKDAIEALMMIEQAKKVKKPRPTRRPILKRLKRWAWNTFMLAVVRIDHIRDAVREEKAGWIMLKREAQNR